MKYLGGKQRIAKKIAAHLERVRPAGAPFFDVFAGGLSVTAATTGERVANDACLPLINMYRAYATGWRPPLVLSEETYQELKSKQDPDDPLTAFAGFGCSFSGKWFGGYARSWAKPGTLTQISKDYPGAVPISMAAAAARGLARKAAAIEASTFFAGDFTDLVIPDGALVYVDPEYRDVERYGFFRESFPHDRFDAWVAALARRCVVLGSEYRPRSPAWVEIDAWSTSKNIAAAPRTERLFAVQA